MTGDDEQEALEMAAALLDLLARGYLARERGGEATDPFSAAEIDTADVEQFVEAQDRGELHSVLAHEASTLDDDMGLVVDLIAPGSPIRAEVLETLKDRISGRLYGTTPKDKQAEIDALLAMAVDLVDGPAPPQQIDVAEVEIETARLPERGRVPWALETWLTDTTLESFRSLWPNIPSIHREYLTPVIRASGDAEWIVGAGVHESFRERDQEWIDRMARREQFVARESDYQASLIVLVVDSTVILGLYSQWTSSQTEVALRTSNRQLVDWGRQVIDHYRSVSHRI